MKTINRFIKLLLLSLAIALPAHADSMYLTLSGQRQGHINGGSTKGAHKDSIKVFTAGHQIVSPRDPASGLPTGKRQHKVLTLTIPMDRSYPLLYSVLVDNENLPTFSLKGFHPSSAGAETEIWSINLTNANIAQIDMTTQTDAKGNAIGQALAVSFTYQKIEWVWTEGGIMGMDDWEAPVGLQ